MNVVWSLLKAAGAAILWAVTTPVTALVVGLSTMAVGAMVGKYGGPGAAVAAEVLQGVGTGLTALSGIRLLFPPLPVVPWWQFGAWRKWFPPLKLGL